MRSWLLVLVTPAILAQVTAPAPSPNIVGSAPWLALLPELGASLVLLVAGLVCLHLSRRQKGHGEFFWLGWYLVDIALSTAVFRLYSAGRLATVADLFVGIPLLYLSTVLLLEFVFGFAGRSLGWRWRIYEGFVLAVPLPLIFLVWAGKLADGPYHALEALVIAPASLIPLVLLLTWSFFGDSAIEWLFIPALFPTLTLVLLEIAALAPYFGVWTAAWMTVLPNFEAFRVQALDLANLMFLLAAGVVILFRTARLSREQARSTAETAAAREIQQRLIPRQLPKVAGYQIEVAYFPAQTVGGDFYQVLAHGEDSTLIVIGDVSGEGLDAATRETLIIGALRSLAGEAVSPAEVLTRLNHQVATEDGFVTCLCAQIDAKGKVTVAAAGHVAPYRNGEEFPLQPGLPLGIRPDEKYEEQSFPMQIADQLTLVSNGVVQAQDRTGSLFGFERLARISRASADSIADAARRFGQTDDITVMTLKRVVDKENVAKAETKVYAIRR